ncbi:MAG: polyprenyl synthetase family protein [Chloroflexota bacterium]
MGELSSHSNVLIPSETSSQRPQSALANPLLNEHRVAEMLNRPVNIGEILNPVQQGLQEVEKKMRTVDSSLFAPLSNALIDLIGSGGKRVRPALALFSARFNGELDDTTYQAVLSVAASVEMLHTASLVHDDVIDGALLRRGSPTLNAEWGAGSTTLAGNYMFGRAAHFSSETQNMQVINIFTETLNVMVEGELRQIAQRFEFAQERESYYQRIYAKTASLFCAATEPAAILTGLSEPVRKALYDYGYHLGMAFQMIDDVLDFSGDESTLGKPAGSDLRQGTVTLPLFYYIQEQPNPSEFIHYLTERREEAYRKGESLWNETVDELVQAICKSNAMDAARAEAYSYLLTAQDSLMALPDNVARQSMLELGSFVVQRSH